MARDVQSAGFSLKEFPTKTGEFAYEVPVPQADSWKTYYEFWKAEGHNPDEVLTEILNAQNKQTGSQSPKQTVRDAVAEAEAAGVDPNDSEAVAEAVAKAREQSAGYVLGAPRAGGGGGPRHETGLTKKQREEFGTAVATAMIEKGGGLSQKDQREIAEALGIDPEALNL